MTVTRRRILTGATALTVTALTRRFAPPLNAMALTASDGSLAASRAVLVLHDGSGAGLLLARRLQASERKADVADAALLVLTREGFKEAHALLARSRGNALVALLNDAETVVLEVLLKACNASALERRRYGRQVLLTARL